MLSVVCVTLIYNVTIFDMELEIKKISDGKF